MQALQETTSARSTARIYATVSHEWFIENYAYDPESGEFWRRHPDGHKRPRCDFISNQGYRVLHLFKGRILAHRAAWFYMTGAWPRETVDHINGDRDDNRWVNLREATVAQNVRSRRTPITNTSGFKGVYYNPNRSPGHRWVAQLWAFGKNKCLGGFRTRRQAHNAYVKAAKEAFGEFAHDGKSPCTIPAPVREVVRRRAEAAEIRPKPRVAVSQSPR